MISILILAILVVHSAISKVMAAPVAGTSAIMAYNQTAQDSTTQLAYKKLAIKRVLEKYNSVLAANADDFMKACENYNLDCYLLPSIAGLESTFGQNIYPRSYNAWGWGRGLIMFKDWADGINTIGAGLRKNYINKGAQDVYEIGRIYSESPTWAVRVEHFMKEFQAEENQISLFFNQNPVQL